jgi:hypothetical protein
MSRHVLDKYICPKCRQFCGLITADRNPDPPTCGERDCPARLDLWEPIRRSDFNSGLSCLTPRQATKRYMTDGG